MQIQSNPNRSGHTRSARTILAVVLLAAIVLTAGGAWWLLKGSAEHPVSLISNCQPTYTGANGRGSATLACSPSYQSTEDGLTSEDLQPFFSTVTYTLSQGEQGKLSNGETIQFEAQYDQELASQLHLKVENTQAVWQVAGLPENYTSWKDFPADEREALDDLAARVLISSLSKEYGQKMTIEDADLVAKYLTTKEVAGRTDTTLYYIVKTVFTREVWWFFGTSDKSAQQYYCITIPNLSPETEMDTTLTGSQATIEKLPSSVETVQEAKDWFVEGHRKATDIFS